MEAQQAEGGVEANLQEITPNLGDYIDIIDCEEDINDKFKITKLCAGFQIKDLPENPEEMLRSLFEKCINDTVNRAEKKFGTKPDRLGAIISSRLLDSDIWIPIRQIHVDTLDNILNKFLLVMQSREREGYGNIYGEPFTIFIHTINSANLPTHQEIIGQGRRRLNPVHHNPNKKALIQVRNRDAFCLFYALEFSRIHASKEMSSNNFHYYISHRIDEQRKNIIDLMTNAGIPLHGVVNYDACVYIPMVVDYWNEKYSNDGISFKVFVFGELGHFKPVFKYGPSDYNIPLAIYHEENHFDGVRNPGSMFQKGYKYCFACLCPYRKSADHTTKCKARCRNCGRMGVGRPCEKETFFKFCTGCGKKFNNRNCYQHHLNNRECQRSKICLKCGKPFNLRNLRKHGMKTHKCGVDFCRTCNKYHKKERGCYIKPLEPREALPYRLVTFDFESTQHTPLSSREPEKRQHCVNFIAAHVACTECLANENWKESLHGKECKICGSHRSITFAQRPFMETHVDKQITTAEPLRDFVRWILFELDNKYTTMAFSHYGGKYDMIITFRQLFQHKLRPKLIRRGNKLYDMHIQKRKDIGNGEVFFRDSFNLCPVSLGTLVPAFGLTTQDKSFFPHLSNNPNNYDHVIPLPPKKDYLYGGFTRKKQREFDAWYIIEQDQNPTFNLNEKLADYCLNDVQILTEALVAFRNEFFKISSGIDILREAITIASACMKHFRMNHLREDHLALVPDQGYDKFDNQSNLALKYFQWYADREGVQIQTAISEEGEYKVGRYKLDGYIEAEDRGIEVNGCIWHAHDCHFPDPDFELPSGDTVGKIREEDEARLRFLNSQLRGGVTVIWECEIREQLANDSIMKKAFDNYEDEGPIRIRDGFMGGRTGPFKMHYQVPVGKRLKYFDYCSLYPYTTATTEFPIGHPICHVMKRAEQGVNWTRPDQIPIKGLLKVFIVPPSLIDVPVMPVKFDDRLLFPLCRTCAQKYPRGHVMPEYSCTHTSDTKRGWVSTCTHIELAESLRNGYRVIKFYRGWEYEEWDGDVFRNYVAEMMELKIHASGFPEGVDEDKFILECREKFEIKIDKSKMKKNAAKRIIAKLMNNNLWGRFSLRNNLCKTHLTQSPAELRKYLDNKAIEVVSIDELTRDCIMITYVPAKEFIEENASSNLILSLWVTSSARLKLLSALQKVARSPGCELLYCDTDSIIFSHPDDNCPLETGPHLGDLTDEFPANDIVEFVSGGCKAYSLRMLHKETGEESSILRVRGITLTGDVSEKLHFTTFKESVLNFANPSHEETMEVDVPNNFTITTYNPNFLQPNIKKGTIISKPLTKIYRPIVTKGIVCRNMTIKDFGSQ
jgi:hypothetical protein